MSLFRLTKHLLDKMRIIYFTTACAKDDYISFCKNWHLSLNTTIQNLHNRLIRSLALTHQIEVISVRPFSKKFCDLKMLPASTTQEGNITWHYLQIKRNRLTRFISAKRQAKKLVSKMFLEDAIILTDTLNPYLLNSSTSLAAKYNLPIIGVCNNTPSGIHNTGRSYTMFLLNAAMDLSGYITLTSGLNELFNEHNRANMTFEGILEDNYHQADVSKYGRYLFYNGNLDEKYGVYDLINAFKEIKDPDLKLIISGYHADTNRMDKAIEGSNIINLGMISLDEIMSFENNAIANINPRPYSEDYDRYLIPNNTIDYLGANSITISVRNSKLMQHFAESVIWLDSSDKDDLVNGINKALTLSNEEREHLIEETRSKANKLYSLTTMNRRMVLFLKQFIK